MRKYAGRMVVAEVLRFFQKIFRSGTAPREWSDSLTIPLSKEKGYALQCGKYRGLRLFEHGMKIWERVLYKRLKHVTEVDENDFGFMEGKSTTGPLSSSDSCKRNIYKRKRSCTTYLLAWKKLSIRYLDQQSGRLCIGKWFQSP